MATPTSFTQPQTTAVRVAVRIRPMSINPATNNSTAAQNTNTADSSLTRASSVDTLASTTTSATLATIHSPESTVPAITRVNENVIQVHPQPSASSSSSVSASEGFWDFDRIFGEETTQAHIFHSEVLPLVNAFLEGFNATVFAYGQTGSGKTYTMGTSTLHNAPSPSRPSTSSSSRPSTPLSRPPTFPPSFDDPNNINTDSSTGIIPRSIAYILQTLQESGSQFDLQASYLELYNETYIDLLKSHPQGRIPALKLNNTPATPEKERDSAPVISIREDPKGALHIQNATLVPVLNLSAAMQLLTLASRLRSTASTLLNDRSSRSHAVLTLTLTRPSNTQRGTLKSKFHFVDLAGSERLKRTQNTGDRKAEGIAINQGLLVLGRVIHALSEPSIPLTPGHQHQQQQQQQVVPYRDSKLTRLLQDSLGGNSRTLMLAHISPHPSDAVESVQTLRYATRARGIRNKVKLGLVVENTKSLEEEIERWKRECEMWKGRCEVLEKECEILRSGGAGSGAVRRLSWGGAQKSVGENENDDEEKVEGGGVEDLRSVSPPVDIDRTTIDEEGIIEEYSDKKEAEEESSTPAFPTAAEASSLPPELSQTHAPPPPPPVPPKPAPIDLKLIDKYRELLQVVKGLKSLTKSDGDENINPRMKHLNFSSLSLWTAIVALICICTSFPTYAVPVTNSTFSVDNVSDFIRFSTNYGSYMVLQKAPAQIILWGLYKSASTPSPAIEITSTADAHAGQVFIAETSEIKGNKFSERTNERDDRGASVFKAIPNTQNLRRWSVKLPPLQAASDKEYSFTVSMGSVSDRIEKVLVGDVWLCSGQSNMQMSLENAFGGEEAIANSAKEFNNNIRVFSVHQHSISEAMEELVEIPLKWSTATPESLRSIYTWNQFSAICYWYGLKLQKERKYPIGLIQSAYGGTFIRGWVPDATEPAYSTCESEPNEYTPEKPSFRDNPSSIWNAMIEPLTYTPIFGTLWYQGEADCNSLIQARSYACRFPALIASWRRLWNQRTGGNTNELMPFGFVQLSTWGNDYPIPCPRFTRLENGTEVPADFTSECTAPTVRFGQTANYGYAPNPAMPGTFMAIAMDYGDPGEGFFGDIHPRSKEPIADRLLRGALDVAYNTPRERWQSARPLSALAENDNSVVISFSNVFLPGSTSEGLIQRSPLGFELCTPEFDCEPATFTILPSKDSIRLRLENPNSVVLQGGKRVGVVRYNWRRVLCEPRKGVLGCGLYTKEEGGLLVPVGPFRMDVKRM
ncbi:hypothetical protein HDV05_002428 [Chytridiales sp. JEL 0842]|nr:hypothetical protein HDV05_002428 [Chytridiales sp. JEL 0842]